MGYYTTFCLSVAGGDWSLIETLRKENEEAAASFDSDGRSLSATKWYEWERDMRAFSAAHPFALFELDGVGETCSDQWRAFFVNGLMQRSIGMMAFEVFNPKRLTA